MEKLAIQIDYTDRLLEEVARIFGKSPTLHTTYSGWWYLNKKQKHCVRMWDLDHVVAAIAVLLSENAISHSATRQCQVHISTIMFSNRTCLALTMNFKIKDQDFQFVSMVYTLFLPGDSCIDVQLSERVEVDVRFVLGLRSPYSHLHL